MPTTGSYQPNIQTAWETLKLLAYGYEPKPGRTGADWNREQLQRIDLRWHDLRHEGACRLLADGVDIRIIQLMLGHASIQQTQRYLNVTDEELRTRTGGELEQQRTTAATRGRRLMRVMAVRARRSARLSPICHQTGLAVTTVGVLERQKPRLLVRILVAGAGFEPATFGL